MLRYPPKVYAALIVSSLLWASMYPAAKPVLGEVGPAHVALVRAVTAGIVLSALVLGRGGSKPLLAVIRERWLATLVYGVNSFVVNSFLSVAALALLPASVNALLNNLHPLWLALGTVALHRAVGSRRVLTGAVLAFVGVGLVLFRDARPEVLSFQSLSLLGVLLSVLCSLGIALSTVLGRALMRTGDAIPTVAIASGMAGFVLAPAVGAGIGFQPLIEALVRPGPTLALLIYLGVGCTSLNFTLWMYALKYVPAAEAAVYQYLVPPLGVALSALFLGEPLTLTFVVGGASIVGGIVWAQTTGSSHERKLVDAHRVKPGHR
ncbi:MAG: DMT family transporter [Chloroflexi bacterium]|nr:DMT family transporter [Chloroflexota bacterium]